MNESDETTSTERAFDAIDVLASQHAVLVAGTAAATGAGVDKLGVLAQDSATTPDAGAASTAANACVLTPELTEGPYFLDGDLIRQDITDARPGAPLELAQILVNNATTCRNRSPMPPSISGIAMPMATTPASPATIRVLIPVRSKRLKPPMRASCVAFNSPMKPAWPNFTPSTRVGIWVAPSTFI